VQFEEEIMSKLGKRLIKAAKEAIAIARGELDPSSYRVHVPTDVGRRQKRRPRRAAHTRKPAAS
jgi:putative transcriptional regulator